jgi:hypothetical protein
MNARLEANVDRSLFFCVAENPPLEDTTAEILGQGWPWSRDHK